MPFQPGQSGNPSGRSKMTVVGEGTPVRYHNSALTIRGKIERFLKKNMGVRQLQTMYNQLKEKERLELLSLLLPYVLSKPSADTLTPAEIDELYAKMENAIRNVESKKAI